MTLLDRYLTRRVLVSTLMALAGLLLVVITIDLLTHRQEQIAKYHVGAWQVVTYYVCYIPVLLFNYQILAVALLVGALMVFGRAAESNEITAALAAGVSLRRLALFPALAALGVSITAFAVQETVGDDAARIARYIEREYFSSKSEDARAGVSWAELDGGWTCHILKFNRKALTGEHLHLHAIRENSLEDIRAERIYWDESRREWIMENGRWAAYDLDQDWNSTVRRVTQEPAPIAEPPEMLFALDEAPETKSFMTLARDLRYAAERGMGVDKEWVYYHAKFARPLLSFIMIWLAIPFAMRLRRGGLGASLGVSVVVGLGYLICFYASLGLGYLEILSPIAAAWAANVIFLMLGMILMYRAPT